MQETKLRQLLKKLQRIEESVAKIRGELEVALTEPASARPAKTAPILDEQAAKAEWEKLRTDLAVSRDPQRHLHDYVQAKSKADLQMILKANALPIASKASKLEVEQQLAQMIKVTQTITG